MNNDSIDIIDISCTAPELPCPMVSRPHLINTLVQLFDSNIEIVCVEGQPGHGKTTLLLEFAETVEAPCFGVFLKATNRLSYDPVLVRSDMANQVNWFLESKRLADDSEPADGDLRTLWGKCAQRLNRNRTPGYIIIDGIHHVPPEEESIKQAIMNLLPFGVKPFRFLFSGDTEKDIFFDNNKPRIKQFQISPFTSHETDEYLQDLIEDKDLRSKYHKALSGTPSLLASIRRQIVTSINQGNEISPSSTMNMESLFGAEWDLAGPFSDSIEKALSFIVAYGHPVDLQTLSKKCSVNKAEIKKAFESLPFLTFSEKSRGWEFSSESFRNYAEEKLKKSVKSATQDIVSSLLEDPDSENSLTRLPLYLEKTGNTEKLLEWFSESRLATILLKTRTAAGIEPTLRKAITICHDGKNDRALTTYSLLRSIIQQISRTAGIEHEIRARGALGDFKGALAVANGVPLVTQRLRLLAVFVASFSNTPGFQIQPQLDEIRELLGQIEISELPGEEAIDIATNLYPVDAKLALNVLREIIQGDIEDSSFEVAIARIKLAALRFKKIGELGEGEDAHYPIPKDILVDKKLRHLLEANAVFYHAKSASEVLNATKSIEDPSERLFVQRKWISRNPFRDDILDIVENVIKDAITVPQFTPNATFYREISISLPYSKHKDRRRKLVEILDGQKSIINLKGPTVDYVRLQLHLAQCNYVDDELSRAASRLEELYWDSVEPITELEARITCLAWFVAKLHHFDSSGKMDEHIDIREAVDKDFRKTLGKVLQDSANQFRILSNALEALAPYMPETALEISRRLNTIERRNEAFLHIIIAMCEAKTTTPDSALLFEILEEMEQGSELNSAISEITKRLCQEVENDAIPITVLEELLSRLDKCSSSSVRAKCLGELAITVEQHSESEALRGSIAQSLLLEFESIASTREKYQIACQLISTLRATCPDLAKEIFGYLANPDRATSISESAEQGLFLILDLLTKASFALAKSDLLTKNDIQRICKMIGGIRDPWLRVDLFSTLAFFLWRENQTSSFLEIVNQQIWPTLSNLNSRDRALTHRAWVVAYPTLWIENRDRARDAVATFPSAVRNECTFALIFTLLRKQPLGEPFDHDSHNAETKVSLSYSDIENLLQLCKETDEDFMIFNVFEQIASKVSSRQSKIHLTREQKAEIARRMLKISETRLPVEHRIQHTGFQILCKAQALRIDKQDNLKWEDLIKEGELIANAADRIYVIAHIASYLPSKKKGERKRLLEKAEKETDSLQNMEDQHERYYMIATLTAENNKEGSFHMLKKALGIVTQSNNLLGASRENRIVDLAYRLNPELPMELAMVYDDDPAREKYKKRAQKQLDALQLKKDIGNFHSSVDLMTLRNGHDLASASWHALAILNSGRMIPADMTRLRNMLTCGSHYPLIESYPMYSWTLSNVMLKYSGTPESAKYIRDMFEGILRAVEFFFRITEADGKLGSSPKWQDLGDNGNQIIVLAGERNKAMDFIQKWLQENAEDYITIVDPYFSDGDLELVLKIVETDPRLRVKIVTGKTNQQSDSNLSSVYYSAWRRLCDHSPPHTEVLVMGSVRTGEAPFHDRWILSKSTGLRLGTSVNSLGNKDSEISVLGSEEFKRLHYRADEYHAKIIREFKGDQVTYESFELLP